MTVSFRVLFDVQAKYKRRKTVFPQTGSILKERIHDPWLYFFLNLRSFKPQ